MSRLEEMWDHLGIEHMLLWPLSGLYQVGWRLYEATYHLGLKQAQKPHDRILCVGNLRVGGTGKTPVTIALVHHLVEWGHSVVVSVSGYGSPGSREATVAPEGPILASRWGDEAAQMRDALPNVPLIVGRNRVRAAELCAQQFPDSVLVLDDGFQHLPLKKDWVLLLDPPSPNTLCLPIGPYRQPANDLEGADLVVPRDLGVERHLTINRDSLPEELDLLCAIARPQRFFAAVHELRTRVNQMVSLPDHDPLTSPKLLESLGQGRPIGVTQKDAVKLRERPDFGSREWVIFDIEARFTDLGALRQSLEPVLSGR